MILKPLQTKPIIAMAFFLLHRSARYAAGKAHRAILMKKVVCMIPIWVSVKPRSIFIYSTVIDKT
jgi:hypothetical protein